MIRCDAIVASVSPYLSRHLARSYGDRAPLVAQLASSSKTAGGSAALGRRLVPGHPVIAAEVVYAARHEYCQTVCDFIARRTRLAFIDVDAAEAALPVVGERGGEVLGSCICVFFLFEKLQPLKCVLTFMTSLLCGTLLCIHS